MQSREVPLPAAHTVLKFWSKTNDTAVIGLCRKTVESESDSRLCFDGLDNDCDGKTDDMDEGCFGVKPCNNDGICDGL